MLIPFISPKYLRSARELVRYGERLEKYRRDVIDENPLKELREAIKDLKQAVKDRQPKEKVDELSAALTKHLEKNSGSRKHAAIREWVEVFLVAIVIAGGLRTYFVQPFRIPTGSMEPTLNGNIITDVGSEKSMPNPIVRSWDFLIRGRTWFDFTPEYDGQIQDIDGMAGKKVIDLNPLRGQPTTPFTGSMVRLSNGESFKLPIPPGQLVEYGIEMRRGVKAGETVVRGYVTKGDFVFVDKVTYHFRKPQRDEIFVFDTRGIEPIEERHQSGDGAHYIKRLIGTGGDEVTIDPPQILINGEKPEKADGIMRVASAEAPYEGYTLPNRDGANTTVMDVARGEATYTVPEDHFLLMGDNSDNSWDGRNFGPVPKRNAVGKAFFVFFPFGSHWGPIRLRDK